MIREKRQGQLSKGILLQQDNARVHTCKIAMDAVERNGYELIPQNKQKSSLFWHQMLCSRAVSYTEILTLLESFHIFFLHIYIYNIIYKTYNWYSLDLAPRWSPRCSMMISWLLTLALSTLAPFLFPNLKKDIRGRYFWSNEEVVATVEEWVRDKDPGFFSSGLMALEHRWSKCIILEGNYIEKEEINLTKIC